MQPLHKPSLTLASKPSAPVRIAMRPSASLDPQADNHLTHADFQNFLSVIQAKRLVRRLRIVKKLDDCQTF